MVDQGASIAATTQRVIDRILSRPGPEKGSFTQENARPLAPATWRSWSAAWQGAHFSLAGTKQIDAKGKVSSQPAVMNAVAAGYMTLGVPPRQVCLGG